jgi:protein arginine kinase
MDLIELSQNLASWLCGTDDADGIVVSCRTRLARNLAAQPFAQKANEENEREVIERVLSAARRIGAMRDAAFFKMDALDASDRRLLVERHLVSPALAESKGQRGVLFNADESLSVMINEEDHLRLQAILPGLSSQKAWGLINSLDDQLGAGLDFAYSEKYGYLTACPTNTGTGLRVSALMHLPALVLTEDIERVLRGLTQMSFTARGVYGEGTNAVGNLFQVSNQGTLGHKEEELVENLSKLAKRLVEYERDAQETLCKEAREQVEDKIWRAYGILSNSRVLSSQEFMNLLSAVRLGYSLSMVPRVTSAFLNQLMIITQPSHLQAEAGRKLKPGERDVIRASLVRRRLQDLQSE